MPMSHFDLIVCNDAKRKVLNWRNLILIFIFSTALFSPIRAFAFSLERCTDKGDVARHIAEDRNRGLPEATVVSVGKGAITSAAAEEGLSPAEVLSRDRPN